MPFLVAKGTRRDDGLGPATVVLDVGGRLRLGRVLVREDSLIEGLGLTLLLGSFGLSVVLLPRSGRGGDGHGLLIGVVVPLRRVDLDAVIGVGVPILAGGAFLDPLAVGVVGRHHWPRFLDNLPFHCSSHRRQSFQ